MPRTVEHEPLKKHTLFLYDGDFDKLAAFFPSVGGSVMIRRIIRSYLDKIDHSVPAAAVEIKVEI